MKIDIYTETEVVKFIQDILDTSDLDDLARIYTDLAMTEQVIVVHDTCRAKTIEGILNGDHAFSNVYQDGVDLGYIDEDAKFQEFPARYEALQREVLGTDVVVPIRDNRTGSVVCYVEPSQVDRILDALETK